ncbi:hypothetical protein NDU88_002956 [Pleurodeles waltl]|uniref:Uncharacterized protein n=1 Tax=Pleurodeles waltl TaxID=8319 RepID=A0AAV7LFJ3_PLEWA|nr:hypothetical protein NDU88_002956 [Pleurodeles waltl]
MQFTQYTGLMPGVGRQGLASTKFGQKDHWTVGVTWIQLLCPRNHARQDERGPRGPVMQKFGAGVSRGKIPSTHRRFLHGFQCRVKTESPQSMHHQETVEKAAGLDATMLLVVIVLLCCGFAGVLEQSEVNPWQKSKSEMQRSSGELLHFLSEEKPTGEALIALRGGLAT